jgi:hypothetical protein
MILSGWSLNNKYQKRYLTLPGLEGAPRTKDAEDKALKEQISPHPPHNTSGRKALPGLEGAEDKTRTRRR